MKWYEKLSRYFLGTWIAICAIDGWALLLFDIHMTEHGGFLFLEHLVNATYFWAFLKIIQTVGALSLLLNYRPALGLALLTPINAVLVLFYAFELLPFMIFGVPIIIATVVLMRTYADSFTPLLADYPSKAKKAKDEAQAESDDKS